MTWYFRAREAGTKYVTMIRRIGHDDSGPTTMYRYSLTDVCESGQILVSEYADSEPQPNLRGKRVIDAREFYDCLERAMFGGGLVPHQSNAPTLQLSLLTQ